MFSRWLKCLEDVWALEKPAKSMVGHLKGKLQCNYRVGSVYVERHTIWREVTTENSVCTIGKSSSVPPLPLGKAQRDYSQKHFSDSSVLDLKQSLNDTKVRKEKIESKDRKYTT